MKIKRFGKLGTALLVLIIGAGITMGALIANFYVLQSASVDSDVVLTWSDTGEFTGEEKNAEDLTEDFTILDFVGNDVENYTWFLHCNDDLNAVALQVNFTIFDTGSDDPEGINIVLEYFDGDSWEEIINWDAEEQGETLGQHSFAPGDTTQFRVTFTGHVYLMEGSHNFAIQTTAAGV